MPVCICALHVYSAQGGLKKASDMWVLGTEPEYSAIATGTLNHWAISLDPEYNWFLARISVVFCRLCKWIPLHRSDRLSRLFRMKLCLIMRCHCLRSTERCIFFHLRKQNSKLWNLYLKLCNLHLLCDRLGPCFLSVLNTQVYSILIRIVSAIDFILLLVWAPLAGTMAVIQYTTLHKKKKIFNSTPPTPFFLVKDCVAAKISFLFYYQFPCLLEHL